MSDNPPQLFSPLKHARVLYADMLRCLRRFRTLRNYVDDALERARRQAERDARVQPGTAEFEELVEQIADRDPTALSAMHVSNRYRDDAIAYALAYLVEVDYSWRTGPFSMSGDMYSELRGNESGK